jgi:hypothetical protein
MAKRATAEKINKSEEIRQLVKSGTKKPADVVAKLAERGISVSTAMVYNVKNAMKARRKAHRIGRQRATADGSAPATDIRLLARFIRATQDVGGIKAARAILNELEE